MEGRIFLILLSAISSTIATDTLDFELKPAGIEQQVQHQAVSAKIQQKIQSFTSVFSEWFTHDRDQVQLTFTSVQIEIHNWPVE